MNTESSLPRRISILLALAVLLPFGQASPATAWEAHQDPAGQVIEGSGAFPRLPVIAPGAVHAWSVSTDCPAFLQS